MLQLKITNRKTQSLEKYLHEIGKVDLICGEEEVNLAKRIAQGDHAALEKLTKANLRFLVSGQAVSELRNHTRHLIK